MQNTNTNTNNQNNEQNQGLFYVVDERTGLVQVVKRG